MMSNETWMNAKKAVELGFADEVLFADGGPDPEPEEKDAAVTAEAEMYSSRMMDQAILNRLGVSGAVQPRAREEPMIGMDGKTEDGAMPYELLRKQLEFLK
jgi:ATP-dependent Clp protease protease subunit